MANVVANAVADEQFAGVTGSVVMKRAAVAVARDFGDDDERSPLLLADGGSVCQHVAQIHHIQNHKFHLPPCPTDSLTAKML